MLLVLMCVLMCVCVCVCVGERRREGTEYVDVNE